MKMIILMTSKVGRGKGSICKLFCFTWLCDNSPLLQEPVDKSRPMRSLPCRIYIVQCLSAQAVTPGTVR